MKPPRRLVITVCPRERGTVALPVTRGGRRRRLDAAAVVRELRALIAGRRLGARVTVMEGCTGDCARPGPNVSVALYALPRAGERPDDVVVARRSYSLATLLCLARLIDDNA